MEANMYVAWTKHEDDSFAAGFDAGYDAANRTVNYAMPNALGVPDWCDLDAYLAGHAEGFHACKVSHVEMASG
jgi:hypothetical protein